MGRLPELKDIYLCFDLSYESQRLKDVGNGGAVRLFCLRGTWLKAPRVITQRREWRVSDSVAFWSADTLYPSIHAVPSAESTD